MGWKIDGRSGTVNIGSGNLEGFALLRDSVKRLIAFHAYPLDERSGLSRVEPRTADQFVIEEDVFKPKPA